MAFKPNLLKEEPSPSVPDPLYVPHINGGICLSRAKSEILDNQSPDMCDIMLSETGDPRKRYGQAYAYATSLGDGGIRADFTYRKTDGTTERLLVHGTVLYKQTGTTAPASLATGLAAVDGTFFQWGSVAYYRNGTDFKSYNGTTCADVTPYVPVWQNGRAPDGTAFATFEDLNILSDSFEIDFNGDNSATEYILPIAVTSVSITGLGSYTFPTGGDYTKITFASTPASGVNNVPVICTKTGLNDESQILKCTIFEHYGGNNDTRMFATGNPDLPAWVFWTDVDNITYWPISNYEVVGATDDPNTAMAKQHVQLIILKEHSVARMDFSITTTGATQYYSFPLNDTIGCDMPESVQLIDNNIVFSNTYSTNHVWIVTDTTERTEKNIMPIGGNIGPALTAETIADLKAASSVDFEGKYILCVKNKAWAWDYRKAPYIMTGDVEADQLRLAWFPWSNINAAHWLLDGRDCYYVDRTIGRLIKLVDDRNDFTTTPILDYWYSKAWHFGAPRCKKTIAKVHFRTGMISGTTTAIPSRLWIQHYDDRGPVGAPAQVVTSAFDWNHFSWDLFSWDVHYFPAEHKLRPKIKKQVYYQFKASNGQLNEDFNLVDLEITYYLTKEAG